MLVNSQSVTYHHECAHKINGMSPAHGKNKNRLFCSTSEDSIMFFNKNNLLCLISRTVLFFLISHVSYAAAMITHTKLWVDTPMTGAITMDKKWGYYLEPQLRLIDDQYKLEQFNLYAGFYYQVLPNLSAWFGAYRQLSNEPGRQQYRLWEQMTWDVMNDDALSLSSRTRLEQRKNINDAEIAHRLREKITLTLPMRLLTNYFLVLADEVFLQLNQPAWVTNRFFSQNRASIGIKIPVNKDTAYEVGYLNQFQYGNPNQMSHVLYLTVSLPF